MLQLKLRRPLEVPRNPITNILARRRANDLTADRSPVLEPDREGDGKTGFH